MGQRLYFCTFTQILRGTTAVTACRQHGRLGQGRPAGSQQALRGPAHSRAAWVPPRSLQAGPGHRGPPQQGRRAVSPGPGCVLARVPQSCGLGPLVWLQGREFGAVLPLQGLILALLWSNQLTSPFPLVASD